MIPQPMSLQDRRLPIGIFDSGVGGLTVLQTMAQKLPQETFVYCGDTARVPYGNKSRSTIVRYSLENAMFLMEQQVKLLVIACNTAAAYSAEKVRRYFKVPVVDVVEAGISAVLSATTKQQIAILATRATIQAGVYQQALSERLPGATITPISCPLFVPLVEERLVDHPAARLLVKEYLAPLKGKSIDTVLLGCTHYPLIAHLIREELGDGVVIIDSAQACTEKVVELLSRHKMQAEQSLGNVHRFFVTDDPDKFSLQAEQVLGWQLGHVEHITLGNHH